MFHIKLGDIVEVLGTEDDQECWWWGEIVGYDPISKEYEVYYIEQKNNNTWKYNDHYDIITKDCINRHVRTARGNYEESWLKMGFIMKKSSDGDIHFLQDANITTNNDTESECGSEETLSSVDTWSSEETLDNEEMIQFIVDDIPDEPKTLNRMPRLED